jgi:hypothetical protein
MADRRQEPGTVPTRRLEQLARDIEPKADLWPGIAEAISEELTSEHSLQALIFDRIPADIEPAVDLWPGIEVRIRRDSTRFPLNRPVRKQYWLLAASLAVVALAGALLVRGPDGIRGPVTGPDVTRNQLDGRGVPVSFDGFPSDLLFPAPRDAYAGEIQETLREHIAAVRSERMRIEESLDRYPADPALRRLWQSTYAQELNLIDTAARVLSTI